LICSNRGLCGNFNSAIIQKAVKSILKQGVNEGRLTEKNVSKNKRDVDFILLGKKGFAVKTRFGLPVVAEFPKQDVVYEMKEVIPVAKLVIDDYLSAKYDKVMVAYTDFVSSSKQIPRVKQLLPIDLIEDEHLGVVGLDSRVGLDKDFIKSKERKYLGAESDTPYVFTYEPDSETILNEILPRLIEVQLFQALLESNASENSVRMSAMKKASEAADDISSELTLHFNKARQASITREISELVAGVNALNN
jgi:F-type H+-transporting ATPase subunit gamma